jgi:hypothetical protein
MPVRSKRWFERESFKHRREEVTSEPCDRDVRCNSLLGSFGIRRFLFELFIHFFGLLNEVWEIRMVELSGQCDSPL